MILKAVKTWSRRLILLVVIFIFFILIYFSYITINVPQYFNRPNVNKTLCDTSKSWKRLGLNESRNTQLFLRLNDVFWNANTSSFSLPYGIKGSDLPVQKALHAMTNYDMPKSLESLACRKCVVIGNGYAIKNSSLGSTINNYDVVIRLNDSPVKGYEQDVGNKTTLRLFYPESATSDPRINNDPDTIMVLVPFKQEDLLWVRQILSNEKRVTRGFWRPPPQIWLGKINQIRILDPFFMRKTASRLLQIPLTMTSMKLQKWIHPTTGMLAIYVALNYCHVVHIAGFGYPKLKDLSHPIHYFGDDTMKSMTDSVHNISLEAQVLKKLEDSGAIMYLHPHA